MTALPHEIIMNLLKTKLNQPCKFAFNLLLLALLAFTIQTASAQVLLTDNFQVSSNSQNINLQLATRQTGTLVAVPVNTAYTAAQGSVQVGNTNTDVGQPGGAANGDFVLLENDASFFSDLNIASVATGPLTIQFDLYIHGTNNPDTSPGDWAAVTLNMLPSGWPVVGTGQFGFLQQVNGGLQLFPGTAPAGWGNAGFATNTHWSLTFSDTNGTGSAFNGNGSQVTFVNGGNTLGTVTYGQLDSAGLRLCFRSLGNLYAGVANLSITGTQATLSPPGKNLSFEYDTTIPGNIVGFVPTSWTAFNQASPGDIGSENSGGSDYTVFDPLAAPADGNNYCYVNLYHNTNALTGVYQDVGALQAYTTYTLTVAIGSRIDIQTLPGIISLLNGTDNTGTVLASTNGVPATQNTWQDYTVSFATGASVSGDLTVELWVDPTLTGSVANGVNNVQGDFDNVRLTVTPIVFNAPIFGAPKVSGGNLILTGTGGTPNAGYTWLTTTNLSAPINWTTNSTGTLDVTGAFSNAIPINALAPAGFFKFRMP
jgi:hypothetical protein